MAFAKKMPTKTTTAVSKAKGKKKAEPRIRDLQSMGEAVERKVNQVTSEAATLGSLRDRAQRVSAALEAAEKDKRQRLDQLAAEIAAHQLAGVEAKLRGHNKVVIDKFEYEALQRHKRMKLEEEQGEKKQLSKDVEEQVREAVRFKELEFQQKAAQVLAMEEARNAERRTYMATIAGLRAEIESQKTLSSDVAMANKQRKINLLSRKALEEAQRKEDIARGLIPAAAPPAAPAAPAAAAAAPAAAPAGAGTPAKVKAKAKPAESETESDEPAGGSRAGRPPVKKAAAKKK